MSHLCQRSPTQTCQDRYLILCPFLTFWCRVPSYLHLGGPSWRNHRWHLGQPWLWLIAYWWKYLGPLKCWNPERGSWIIHPNCVCIPPNLSAKIILAEGMCAAGCVCVLTTLGYLSYHLWDVQVAATWNLRGLSPTSNISEHLRLLEAFCEASMGTWRMIWHLTFFGPYLRVFCHMDSAQPWSMPSLWPEKDVSGRAFSSLGLLQRHPIDISCAPGQP